MQAQNDSNIGRFSSDFVVGCAPLTINLTVNDGLGSIVRQYVYEEGQPATNDTFHTYNVPGTYNIIQIIQSQTPRTDTLEIVVHEAVTPTFEIFNCSLNRARILPNTVATYDFYRVYFEMDSITALPNQISEVINFSNSNVQTIRLRGFINNAPNNCGEVSFNFDPIGTIDIPEITDFQVNQHCLNLAQVNLSVDITESVRHLVEISTDQINFSILDTISNTTTYSRSDIPIGTQSLCVRLVALDECDNARVESQISCFNDLLTEIPIVNDVNASFISPNTVNFIWDEVNIEEVSYEITNLSTSTTVSVLGNIQTIPHNEQSVIDFNLIPIDSCGNQASGSIVIRPIFLRANKTGTNNFDFEWNNYLGWANGQADVTYDLEILNEELNVVNREPINNNFFTRNIGRDNGASFRIRAIDNVRNRRVLSNIITLEQESQIQLPTAFTPNGDGRNDIFSPILLEDVNNFRMTIYNRWGEVIFTSNSRLVGWDGKDRRGIAQNGTYTYRISFSEENGSTVNQTGTFLLIR